MAARRTTTFKQWVSAHWCLSNSSIGTDSGCYGDCSPVLAVAVTIGTVIPTVSAWLTKHLAVVVASTALAVVATTIIAVVASTASREVGS